MLMQMSGSHVISVNIMWRDLISQEETPRVDDDDMHVLFYFFFL